LGDATSIPSNKRHGKNVEDDFLEYLTANPPVFNKEYQGSLWPSDPVKNWEMQSSHTYAGGIKRFYLQQEYFSLLAGAFQWVIPKPTSEHEARGGVEVPACTLHVGLQSSYIWSGIRRWDWK
jgi:hypothetical protein